MVSFETQQVMLVGSAATLYIPGLVACFNQPFPIAISILVSATASLVYHINAEKKFSVTDMIFAHIVLLLALILFVLMSMKLGMFHWKVMLATFLSAAAIATYLNAGKSGEFGPRSENYWWLHGMWHLMGSMGILVVVSEETDWNLLWCTYKQTLVKAYRVRPIDEIQKNADDLANVLKLDPPVIEQPTTYATFTK